MKISKNVFLLFSACLILGLFFTHELQSQTRSLQKSTSSPFNGDDPRIKQSRNTVPSSGHDHDLMVLKVSGNHISSQPLKTLPNFNPNEVKTQQLNQGTPNQTTQYSRARRTSVSMPMKSEVSTSPNRVALTSLKPLNKTMELTVLRPLIQGQASLLLKSPYEVNFLKNEAMMYRSSAIASFQVQKGKSYIVTVHTRMMPNKRTKEVSLNLNYVVGGENTAVRLSKSAKSSSAELYEFKAVLEADGNGYINLDMQNEDNGGRWWFSKVEVQQVGY